MQYDDATNAAPNGFITCTADGNDDFDTARSTCNVAGLDTEYHLWFDKSTITYTAFTVAEFDAAIAENAFEIVWDTVGGDGDCIYDNAGGQTSVIDIKDKICDGDAANTLITSNTAQRIGPPLEYVQASVDFYGTDGSDPTCKFGIKWDAEPNLRPITPVFQKPYDAAAGTWDASNANCDSEFTLDRAYTVVENPRRGKVVIDLLKFKCYLPWDCIPRRLEIDENRWTEVGIDRKTDAHLYQCIIESTEANKKIDTYTAQDYMYIGNPDYIHDSYTAFKLVVGDPTIGAPAQWGCQYGTTNIEKYALDMQRGLCFRWATDETFEAFHVARQQYNTNSLIGIDNALDGVNRKAFIDMYNNRCFYRADAGGSTTQCNSAAYKFNMETQSYFYVCDCNGSNIYFEDKDDSVDAEFYAMGRQHHEWSCASEVINVNLKTNKCYKGDYEMNFDPDRYWCGGIPLAIHQFDIVEWEWKDAQGDNVVLIDLFNEVCKEYDHDKRMIKQFERLTTIPHDTDKSTSIGSEFKCTNMFTGVENIKYQDGDAAKKGILFGEKYWVSDSRGASNAVVLSAAKIDFRTEANTNYKGSVIVADSTTHTAGDVALSTFADEIDKHRIRGKLIIEWGIVFDIDAGPTLYNTYDAPALTDIDGDGDIQDTGSADPVFDWTHNKCYIGNVNGGNGCTPNGNTESVSVLSSINRDGFQYQCYCDAKVSTLKLFTDVPASANAISHNRRHLIYYYDDKMRIDLEDNPDYGACSWKGMQLHWSSNTRKCYYKNDPKKYRAPLEFFYELDYINYEVTNINYPAEADSIFVDFVQNTCHIKGSPFTLELLLQKTDLITSTYGQHTALNTNEVKCKGFKDSNTFLSDTDQDMNGRKMTFLGSPFINADATVSYTVDLENLMCYKKRVADGQVLQTALFSLEKQFCYGEFWLPLWWNNYQVESQQGIQNYLDAQNSKIIAVLDIKNSQCYIKDQALTPCALTTSVTDANTSMEDTHYSCDCEATSQTTYLFSKRYETNVNFVFLGYKYIELTNEEVFEGESPISNPLDDQVLIIKPYAAGNTIGDAECWYMGQKCDDIDEATGIATIGGNPHHIAEMDYQIQMDYWHKSDQNKLWLIDYIQMKCYEKNTCNVYNLEIEDIKNDNSDNANKVFTCNLGATSITSFDIDGLYDVMFQTVFDVPAVADVVVINYDISKCVITNNQVIKYTDLIPRYNICKSINNDKYYRLFLSHSASDGNDVTMTGETQYFQALTGGASIGDDTIFIDWRNNLLCGCAADADNTPVLGSFDGATLTCDCGGGDIYTRSVTDNYLQGTKFQIIGYSPDETCDDNNKTFKLDLENDKCYYRGFEFTYQPVEFKCVDESGNNFPQIDLRSVSYEILIWPTNKLYVADFNQMKCLSPGGNDAHLYYKESTGTDPVIAEVIECRRLTINGWEKFEGASNDQILIIGRDDTKFGSTNLHYIIDFTKPPSCWKDAIGNANGGISRGNFEIDEGICLLNKVRTGYIGYNTPELANVPTFFTDNPGLEMIYLVTQEKDTCATSTETDHTKCVATMEYDYYATHYPEVKFECTCEGREALVLKYSDNKAKLRIMGPITSRFLSSNWYKTIDIDPVLYQCTSGTTKYNYNELTKSCYHIEDRLYIYRQFYEIYNWKGKTEDKTLIDHFRQSCFHRDDCTPMKFSHFTTWDSKMTLAPFDADPNNDEPETQYAFCNRIVNEDVGFTERVNNFSEFGLHYNNDDDRKISGIDSQNHACTITNADPTKRLFYDAELQACVNLDQEDDYPVHEQASTAVVDSYIGDDKYLIWDKNVLKAGNKKVYILPSLNQCIIHTCDQINADDGTCTNPAANEHRYKGYITYGKDHQGKLTWFCHSEQVKQEIKSEDAHFIGTGMKQIFNHCASLDSIYGELENKTKYWIHIQINDGANKCMLLYGKPDPNVWDFNQKEYIPFDHYYWKGWGYNELNGRQTGNIDNGGGAFQARADAELDFDGLTYHEGSQRCGNTPIRHFDYDFETRLTPGNEKGIWDWNQSTCTLFDTTAFLTDDGGVVQGNYVIYDIEPHQSKKDKWFCTGDRLFRDGLGEPLDFDFQQDIAAADFYSASTDAGTNGNDQLTSVAAEAQTLILKQEVDTNEAFNLIKITTADRKCYEYDGNYEGAESDYGFFDDRHNTCRYDRQVGHTFKRIVLEDDEKAFIDLGQKRCLYGNRSGHLIRFKDDHQKYFASDYNVAGKREEQSLTQDFEDFEYEIKCRFYDIDVTPHEFMIKEFNVDEVFIGGLDRYMRQPGENWESHLTLYLISITHTSNNQLVYKCYPYFDDERMYNPLEPFNLSEVPSDSTPGWETYTLSDHKCGSISLQDKYYKIVIPDSNNFPYQYIADVWGDRCFSSSNTISKLHYDEWGKANVCVPPEEDDDKVYISFEFKVYNDQKNNKRSASLLPTLPKKYLNTRSTSKITFQNERECDNADANKKLNFETGMCLDENPTPNEFINMCLELYDANAFDTTVRDYVMDKFQYMGILDLCQKTCHVRDDDNVDRVYTLTTLNEFEMICKDATGTLSITRYNDEYDLFADRGQWFSLKEQNSFKITRIELDLTLTKDGNGNWLKPKCTVGDFTAPGDQWQYDLEYRETDENSLCFIEDWWCEQTDNEERTFKFFYSDPDNHFVINTIDSSDGDVAAPFGFLQPGNEEAPLKHRCLVDVFNGKCYFPHTPDQAAKSNNGHDIVLDQNTKEIFASIDNFTEAQLNNLIFTCDNTNFSLHHIYFVGFKNVINVDNCPKGTFKHPVTGHCKLCMYECDDCTSDDRCDDCRDNIGNTSDYLACGPRCFKVVDPANPTELETFANLGENKVFWDPTPKVCKWCPYSCFDCDSFTECTSCEEGYVLYTDPNDNTQKSCISHEACDAIQNYFSDGTACTECDAACTDCRGSATNCVQCADGTEFLEPTGVNTWTCVNDCTNGYYLDATFNKCLPCQGNCDTCTGTTVGNDIFQGDQCIDITSGDSNPCNPAGFYKQTIVAGPPEEYVCSDRCQFNKYVDANACQDCDDSCAACAGGNSNQCTFCDFSLAFNREDGLVQGQGECISFCKEGRFEYREYLQGKINANPNFKLPSTPVEFTQFVEFQPYNVCDYEQKNNQIDVDSMPKFCVPCHSSCEACQGPDSEDCDRCLAGKFKRLDSNDKNLGCFDNCPVGYREDSVNRVCQACSTDRCTECETDGNNQEVCLKCETNYFLDPLSNLCQSECGEGYFANALTQECTLCDKSKVTTCETYATKGLSCSEVVGKGKLNLIDNTCVPICPSGTYEVNNDQVSNQCATCGRPTCAADGTPSGDCLAESHCDTCWEADKCLTCQSGFLFLEDTYACHQGTECPESYRIDPTNSRRCQKCRENEKTCDLWGAKECRDDESNKSYVLKGWPIKYCVEDIVAPSDECRETDKPWYEDGETEKECQQCSNYCETCYDEMVCKTCTDYTDSDGNNVVVDPQQFCFDKTESGALCLCDLEFEYTLDEPLMELTVKFNKDVNVDWNYFLDNRSSILGNNGFKSKVLSLGSLMKQEYDTQKYKEHTPQAMLSSFITDFYYLNKLSQNDIVQANLNFQDTVGKTLYPDEGVYVSRVVFDETKQFGEQEAGEVLPEVIFEHQNWSNFGTYSYEVNFVGGKKEIKIHLGRDHTYNPFTNPLILRKDVLRRVNCPYPYKQIDNPATKIEDLPIPIIELTTNFGGTIDNPATIPYCAVPEIIVNYQDFPKFVPENIKWSLYNNLEKPDGSPDEDKRKEIQSILDNLKKEETRFIFNDDLIQYLAGYTAHIRVEATPFFTGDIAVSTLTVKFDGSTDANNNQNNMSLQFRNTFTEFRYLREFATVSPSFDMYLPPCVLGGKNKKDKIKEYAFLAQYFQEDCSGAAEGTFNFDKDNMNFKIAAKEFPAGTNKCVKITVPDPATPVVGIDPVTYTFKLIPEAQYPLISTDFGNYLEVEYGAQLEIPFSVKFDEADVVATTFTCVTNCGKSCDYLNDQSQARPLVGTFEGEATSHDRKLIVASGQMAEETIYRFHLNAGYKSQRDSKEIVVKVLKQGLQKLSGTWKVKGINAQKYALGNEQVVFEVLFDGVTSFQSTDILTWSYEQKDQNGEWQRVPLYDSSNQLNSNYNLKENKLIIHKVQEERYHRVILDATVQGKVGRFVHEMDTISGIDVDCSVSPLQGTTRTLFTFICDRKTLEQKQQKLSFIWRAVNGNQIQTIGQTDEDIYKNYITTIGDKSNSYEIELQLEVLNEQTLARRIYRATVAVQEGVWKVTDLDEIINLDQVNSAIVGISQQTDLTPQDQDSFQTAVESQIAKIDTTTDSGRATRDSLIDARINAIKENPGTADDVGKDKVKEIATQFVQSDSAIVYTAMETETTEDEEIKGALIIQTTTFEQKVQRQEDLLGINDQISKDNATELPVNELRQIYRTMRKYLRMLIAKIGPVMVPGEVFTTTTERQGIMVMRTDSNPPVTLNFSRKLGIITQTADRRMLQDTSESDAQNTQTTAETEEENPDYGCSIQYVLGSSTLSGHQGLVVSVTQYERDAFSSQYIPLDDESGLGTGVPLCDPAEFQLQTSQAQSDTTTDVNLLYLNAQTDQDKFSVCFLLEKTWEDEQLPTIRLYDSSTDTWIIEGEYDEQNSESENNKYCQRISKSGLYAIYAPLMQNESRLYEGFILYVLLIIDIILIVGVIIGAKLDSNQKSFANQPKRLATDEDKLYTGEEKTSAIAPDGPDNTMMTEHSNVTARTEVVPTAAQRQEPTFCGVFKIYHRLINVYTSHYHTLKRPSRVFSFALQLAILCNVIGVLVYALDFGNLAAEGAVGYAVCFVALRLSNLLFYRLLLLGQIRGGWRRILIIVSFVLVYLGLHASGVFVTLLMAESDFTTWTVSFFVCVVVDLVVWELIVTAWQLRAIKTLRTGRKPCCEWQVSLALKNLYYKK